MIDCKPALMRAGSNGHGRNDRHFLIKRVCNRIISVRFFTPLFKVSGTKAFGQHRNRQDPGHGTAQNPRPVGYGWLPHRRSCWHPGTDKELKRDDSPVDRSIYSMPSPGVINEQLVAAFVHHVHGYGCGRLRRTTDKMQNGLSRRDAVQSTLPTNVAE